MTEDEGGGGETDRGERRERSGMQVKLRRSMDPWVAGDGVGRMSGEVGIRCNEVYSGYVTCPLVQSVSRVTTLK